MGNRKRVARSRPAQADSRRSHFSKQSNNNSNTHSTADELLLLQHQLGNKAVQRLVEDGYLVGERAANTVPRLIQRSRPGRQPGLAEGPKEQQLPEPSLISGNTIQRQANTEQKNKQELQPRMGVQAIADMRRLSRGLKIYRRFIHFAPFQRELALGTLMAQLLQLQPGYKMTVIKEFFDKGYKEGFDPARFAGVTIEYKHREYTPQQWYSWIDKHRIIPDFDKPDIKLYIYSAYYLRAVRNAIAAHKADKQSVLHGASLGLDYGPYYLFRVALKCLASRLPDNVNFDENMWGARLLQMTNNKLTRESLPAYVDPVVPLPKQNIPVPLLFKQITGRDMISRAKIEDKDAFDNWGNTALGSSLIFTILDAKTYYPKMWGSELRARDVTENELKTMEKKQKAWLRKKLMGKR